MQTISDWRRLRKLRAEERRIAQSYRKSYAELDKAGHQDAISNLIDQLGQDRLRNSIAIESVKTSQLLRKAEKYDVPVPSMLMLGNRNESWFESPFEKHTKILNERARATLRAEIWEVQRARWESWTRWVPFLAGLTGLLGAAIGVMAAIAKWF